MTICAECTAARMAWLDSRPSRVFPRLSFTFGSGARYDSTPAGIRDNSRARYEKWRILVGEQMAAIARHCREAGHVSPPLPAPRVVQLDLFELVAVAP